MYIFETQPKNYGSVTKFQFLFVYRNIKSKANGDQSVVSISDNLVKLKLDDDNNCNAQPAEACHATQHGIDNVNTQTATAPIYRDPNLAPYIGNMMIARLDDAVKPFSKLKDNIYLMRQWKTEGIRRQDYLPDIFHLLLSTDDGTRCSCLHNLDIHNFQCVHCDVFDYITENQHQWSIDVVPTFEPHNINSDKTLYKFNRRKGITQFYIYAKWENGGTPDFALITYDKSRVRIECQLCKGTTDKCHHADAVSDWIGVTKESDEEENIDDSKETFKPISTKTIWFPMNSSERELSKQAQKTYPDIENLYPEYRQDARCPHGAPYKEGYPIVMGWTNGVKSKAYFQIDQKQFKFVSVYFRPSTCGVKDCRQEYDGLEDYILNATDSYLISHDLLHTAINWLQVQHSTLAAFVELTHRIRNNEESFPIHQFYKAYWSFLGLLRLRNEEEQFSCNECKMAKRIIIACDGIQMGCSR